MTELEKSFEIQRRRMVLTVVGNSRSGYDLRDREQCMFYFGDGQFILRPMTVRRGQISLYLPPFSAKFSGFFTNVMRILEMLTVSIDVR